MQKTAFSPKKHFNNALAENEMTAQDTASTISYSKIILFTTKRALVRAHIPTKTEQPVTR